MSKAWVSSAVQLMQSETPNDNVWCWEISSFLKSGAYGKPQNIFKSFLHTFIVTVYFRQTTLKWHLKTKATEVTLWSSLGQGQIK